MPLISASSESFFGPALRDLDQRAVAEHLERRAIHLPRAAIAHEVELAQHRQRLRIELARALDAQVAELVELAIGPAPPAQRLELLLRPAVALRVLELAPEPLGERQQIQHVGRRIAHLLLRERAARPVGALLVLGQVHVEVAARRSATGPPTDSRAAAPRSSCRTGSRTRTSSRA
jgi:hypothetical protein